jgi:hypothetical protein
MALEKLFIKTVYTSNPSWEVTKFPNEFSSELTTFKYIGDPTLVL